MSLILKGINLPKEDHWINVIIFPDGTVFTKVNCGENTEKAKAIQIPEGHGDIKDENEIIKRLEEKEKEPLYQHDTDDWWVGIMDAETVVNNSPTILEAEE